MLKTVYDKQNIKSFFVVKTEILQTFPQFRHLYQLQNSQVLMVRFSIRLAGRRKNEDEEERDEENRCCRIPRWYVTSNISIRRHVQLCTRRVNVNV